MLNQALIIARKEILDSVRDTRSLLSAVFYAGMGPGLVFMVSLATARKGNSAALIGMMSVFILLAAFVGGMSVAMDVLAGERERRSLLPLLMNPLSRRDVLLGKWLAVALFSLGGLAVSLLGFAPMLLKIGAGMSPFLLFALACGLLPLALLAAALELAVSTVCRSVKEAHTYLSLLVFAPMGAGMFLVFFPQATDGWIRVTPIVGQQLLVESWMRTGTAEPLSLLVLALTTSMVTTVVLLAAAKRLEQDDVLYGS